MFWRTVSSAVTISVVRLVCVYVCPHYTSLDHYSVIRLEGDFEVTAQMLPWWDGAQTPRPMCITQRSRPYLSIQMSNIDLKQIVWIITQSQEGEYWNSLVQIFTLVRQMSHRRVMCIVLRAGSHKEVKCQKLVQNILSGLTVIRRKISKYFGIHLYPDETARRAEELFGSKHTVTFRGQMSKIGLNNRKNCPDHCPNWKVLKTNWHKSFLWLVDMLCARPVSLAKRSGSLWLRTEISNSGLLLCAPRMFLPVFRMYQYFSNGHGSYIICIL